MDLCKSVPTYLGFSQENPKHSRPWYLPSKLINLFSDNSSKANGVPRAAESDNSGLRMIVELPSSVTEKSEAGDSTDSEISSKLGSDNTEDCEKKSEDYVDSWSLCQPEKSFESLLGDLPAPRSNTQAPCSLWICPVSKNSCSNPLKCGYNLQFCTESLGFESSDEREDCSAESNSLMNLGGEEDEEEKRALENDSVYFYEAIDNGGAENVINSAVCVQRHGPLGAKIRCSGQSRATGTPSKFPPPLPSIARNGQPGVFLKPLRKDGRFLLQEVKVPSHDFLHASRQDGRLRLQLVRNHDDHSSRSEVTATGC